MSIVEQVESLDIKIDNQKKYDEYEESLRKYHKMVESGQLKPRGCQVQSTYTVFSIKSNYS